MSSDTSSQSALSYFLLNIFSGKSFDRNTISQVAMVSLVPTATRLSDKFIDYLIALVLKFIKNNQLFLFYIYSKYFKVQSIKKEMIVSYLTEKKDINRLFESVYWYLTSKYSADLILETPVEISITDAEQSKKSDVVKPLVKIANDKYQEIEYEGFTINAIYANELTTIYLDKERKRENYKITLSCDIKKNCTRDILQEFCMFCYSEHQKYKNPTNWKQKIFINNKDGNGDKWIELESTNNRKIDTIALDGNLAEELKETIDDFISSKDWYLERGIPYKKGFLFYGPPGTGKTSIINGISNYTKKHIYYIIPQNIPDDQSLFKLFSDINYDKAIIVLEDFDRIAITIDGNNIENNTKSPEQIESLLNDKKSEEPQITAGEAVMTTIAMKLLEDKKKNKPPKSGITLPGLLNTLDGIVQSDGRILIMTCNHIKAIDPAIIRPGRIDMKILLDYATHDQIAKIYKMMFGKDADPTDIRKLENKKYSPAAITSFFVSYKKHPERIFDNLDKIELYTEYNEKKIINTDHLDVLANKKRNNYNNDYDDD